MGRQVPRVARVGVAGKPRMSTPKLGDGGVLERLEARLRAAQEAAKACAAPKAPRQRKADGRGHFFAVDARTWGHVCAQGMAPACAYLVLARFSGGDNATTKASVQAIEKHTAISRRHARAALDALVAAKAIEQSTTPRGFPLYKLRAWREVSPTPVAESDAPQWVWLPNQLVTGTTAGEVPPVERVRQTGDVGALRLLVDLYNAHDLAGDGGIAANVLWWPYTRAHVATVGACAAWAFVREKDKWSSNTGPHIEPHITTKTVPRPGKAHATERVCTAFWDRFQVLERLGFLHWYANVYDNPNGGEVVYPLGSPYDAKAPPTEMEQRLYRAAHAAAAAVAERAGVELPANHVCAVVPAHMGNVGVRAVARLRYRPKTSTTARWFYDLNTTGEAWARRLEAVAAQDFGAIVGAAVGE